MTAQVLSFKPRSLENLERYIVIQANFSHDSNDRFCLSPEVMHWHQDLWLIDIGRTKRYWLAQTLHDSISLEELLLRKIKEANLTLKRWIQCSHPWQGIFLIKHLPEQQSLYDFKARFCQNRAKDIRWSEWLEESEVLLQHLEENIRSSRLQRFQSKKLQLLRAMDRLGLENTYDIKEADSSSMQKRFGYWVSKLWEWTFPEKDTELPLLQSLNDLNEFIWISQKPKDFPKRHRALDYSVELWDSLVPFLVEDFEFLKRKYFSQKKYSICEIQWTLELYSGKSIPINVNFRNPYAIFQDAPDYSIALAQCRFQYEAWQANLQEEKNYSNYPEAYKIVSWRMEVSKTLFSELKEQSLNSNYEGANYFKILDLENKLPKPIQQYRVKKSFLLSSHARKAIDEQEDLVNEQLWKHSGSLRPLFKYKEKNKLNSLASSSYFLERNSRDWWKDKHSQNYNQDFFKLYQSREWKWLSKNTKGEIFELGKFD